MTGQIIAPSHPGRNCLGQVPGVHFRVLATWLLKFPVPSQPPPDAQSSSRDVAPPDLTQEEGCVPLLWQHCISDEQNEKTDPLWFRFSSTCKAFFCEYYSKGNVWRGLLSATQRGRSGTPGEKQSLLWDKMLSGKYCIFAFISESHWTILKALLCDSPCRPEEAFEFLTSLVLLVLGSAHYWPYSPKLLTAIALLQIWSQSLLLQVKKRFLK